MTKQINPISISSLAIVLFFGLALQAFAYDNLEIEIEIEDNQTEVDIDYDEDGDEVELEFTYDTDDIDEVYENIADELDLSVAEVTAAVTEMEDEEERDDEDEAEDEQEDDEDMDDDKKRPAACDKNDNERAVGLRALCADDDRLKNQAIKCRVDMLRDGERDRKFCRDGEWVEKRQAKLDDILSGYLESSELDEEETEAIKAEVRELITQLIALVMKARLGS